MKEMDPAGGGGAPAAPRGSANGDPIHFAQVRVDAKLSKKYEYDYRYTNLKEMSKMAAIWQYDDTNNKAIKFRTV